MATIDNNNLPKGVTYQENTGLYVITNSKGQTSRVNADSAAQLNTYNTSWQTGKPTTVTVVDSNGNTNTKEYNPSNIIGQQQATTEYQANLTALKRADVLPNNDGTYSSRTTGAVLTEAELQQKVAAAGLPPNTLEIQKNNGKFIPNPTPASVEASTAAVNDVTNTPSNLTPAPADPLTGTANSPLTVDSKLGATIVKEEPNLAQNAAVIGRNIQVKQVPTDTNPAQAAAGDNNIADKKVATDNLAQDNVTGVDAQVQRQQQITDLGDFAGVDEQIAAQKFANEGQDNVTGVDEQIAAQKFANEGQDNVTGVDAQAANQKALASEEAERNRENSNSSGLTTDKFITITQPTQQDIANFKAKEDWRVRLSLSPGATYLYKASNPGILLPLQATDGVIFPYTPAISVAYAAHYDAATLTHSNYKIFQYGSSSVDTITISCDFTAQDVYEADYLLAVIHFFKSVTKMFYGQDQNPKPGTPPPLCYLSGLGQFQFDAHPLAVTSFNYTLPTDVDYIRSGSTSGSTTQRADREEDTLPPKGKPGESAMAQRMATSGIQTGGRSAPPKFSAPIKNTEATYVPTKMQISITAIPIVTRNDISNKFSVRDYATGALLQGTKRQGGGIW